MKKSGCAILVLFVAVCASMFANLLLFAALMGFQGTSRVAGIKAVQPKAFEEMVVKDGTDSAKKIVVIPLDGVIANGTPGALGDDMVEDFKNALQQAKEDPTVKAVVISVDSPGGEITASDVLYHSLQEFSKEKPSVVYFNSIGASGAYYTACGGTFVMCNSTTFTGSIGVIISALNYKDLFGKIGLQSVVFKSGAFKDMLNGAREMTPEEKTYIQGLVMQSYGRFVGIVAKARNIDEQVLRNGIADGRILSGTDAFAAKLVDDLGYIEDAYTKAGELGKASGAQVVRYKRAVSFGSLLRMFGESSVKPPTVKVDLFENSVKLQPGRIYLLPAFFALISAVELLVLGLLSAGCLFYLYRFLRLTPRPPSTEIADVRFGGGDLFVAGTLFAFFLGNTFDSWGKKQAFTVPVIIASCLLYLFFIIGLVGFLIARHRNPIRLFGLRWSRWRSEIPRVLLALACLYPIIILVQVIMQKIYGPEAEPQEILQFLLNSPDLPKRLLLIFMAVVMAPLAEETIFRGYLHGVFRQYLGRWPSILVTSALFALIHAHVPALLGLFILAIFLSLVYEKTGSLWANIMLHSVFNSVTIVGTLLFPSYMQ